MIFSDLPSAGLVPSLPTNWVAAPAGTTTLDPSGAQRWTSADGTRGSTTYVPLEAPRAPTQPWTPTPDRPYATEGGQTPPRSYIATPGTGPALIPARGTGMSTTTLIAIGAGAVVAAFILFKK